MIFKEAEQNKMKNKPTAKQTAYEVEFSNTEKHLKSKYNDRVFMKVCMQACLSAQSILFFRVSVAEQQKCWFPSDPQTKLFFSKTLGKKLLVENLFWRADSSAIVFFPPAFAGVCSRK